jgi:Zn-finger nucleic acid-binding protein
MTERLDITYDDFKRLITDCEITPIHVNKEAAGALFVIGAEVHACVLHKFKGVWFSRMVFRLLNKIIEKHGYVQTKATTQEGDYFVRRLGFSPIGNVYRRTKKWA